MLRTQISLTAEERRVLDTASAQTGRSISALIRAAVDAMYGDERSAAHDLAAMRRAFGSWTDREVDGAAWVDELRSGSRGAGRHPGPHDGRSEPRVEDVR